MPISTVSTKVLKTVTLGSSSYASQLTVTNTGAVLPKTAGASGVIGAGTGAVLTNNGTIQGAAGAKGRNGKAGGFGVRLTGGTVINTGVISGGAGGNGTVRGGAGGIGVYLNGGTLVNAGAISGRAGGTGAAVNGADGAAVKFGAAAGALVLRAGATFYGQVTGNGSNTALVLDSSASSGTLTGLGTQFTGFVSVTETAGATWTLAGANTLGAGVTLAAAGALSVAGGSLINHGRIDGPVTVAGGGTLLNGTSIGGGANGVVVTGGGVLENQTGATIAGSTNAVSVSGSGTVVFDPGAVFAGKVVASGTGGTLELAGGATAGTLAGLGSSISGFTSVNVDAGASWYLSGANTVAAGEVLAVAGAFYSNGSLTVAGTVDVTGSVVGDLTLAQGGVVINEASANVSGQITAGYRVGPISLMNSGTVSGYIGVNGRGGGYVHNGASGRIAGTDTAVRFFLGNATVVNDGTITGSSWGVRIGNGAAQVVNETGGFISSDYVAIFTYSQPSNVANNGVVKTSNRLAIRSDSGGSVSNGLSGTIVGGIQISGGSGTLTNAGSVNSGYTGVNLQNGGTIVNSGAVVGTALGISLTTGGNVTNSGTISGTTGLYTRSGVVTNGGTITGTSGTAVQFGTLSGTLVVQSGAQFNGNVLGNNKNDAFVLGSSASAGTLSGLGSQFVGFTTFAEAAGATWTLTGTNTPNGAGISLGNASTVTNSGTLNGSVIATGSAVLATNFGTIAAGSAVGVSLANGGTFFNGVYTIATGARITAGTGILSSGAYAYARSFGTIVADIGMNLSAGGKGVNGSTFVSSALIQATSVGMEAGGAASRLANDGTVMATGSAGIGAMLAAGGKVNNGFYHVPSALMSGTQYGVLADGGKSIVVNYGTITGGIGVVLGANTTFGTLTNMGTIIGTGGTAVELIHGADTVAVTPGAVFIGNVVGASAYDVLSLGTGTGTGTLSGLGSQFTGFAAVNVSNGANWVLSGNAIGSSTISIGTNATLGVTGALSVAKVKFLAGSNILQLGSPLSTSSVFSGFAAGDVIDLQGKVATGISFSSATDVLTVRGAGGTLASLRFSSAYAGHTFQFGSDGHGGTNITIT